jgi:class 3 adenylate cyclase
LCTEAAHRFRELGIQIRAGAHKGECEFEGGRLSGDAVMIAEQILAKAAPGEILVSATIKYLVPGSEIEFRGPARALE